MAGDKQHFIPQFVLRKFGVKNRKDEYVVYIYEKNRKTRPSNTERFGFENYFYYSRVSESNKTDLDADITNFEIKMLKIHTNIVNSAEVCLGKSADISEFVTHLSIRSGNMRKTFLLGTNDIIEYVASSMSDERHVLDLMGVTHKSDAFKQTIREAYEENPALSKKGITVEQFEDLALKWAKVNKSEIAKVGLIFAHMLRDPALKVGEKIRDGHNNALRKGLSPEARIKMISNFEWRKIHTREEIVLPDCVAIGISDELIAPFFMFGGKNIPNQIFMPISSDSFLIGWDTELQNLDGIDWNLMSARSSYDFFIARSGPLQFDHLRPEIGISVTAAIRESVEYAKERIK